MIKSVVCAMGFLLGGALWLGFALRFDDQKKLDFDPNIAALKGSPYGKVLVLMMQGKIEVYFHEGERHEDMEFLRPNTEDGHHEHGENCGCEVDSSEGEVDENALHVRLRRYFKRLDAFAHRKTDGGELSPAHKAYLQGVIEEKLRFAYELDPANYQNYEGLYLYLTSKGLGHSGADDDAALDLSRRTLAYCRQEEVDPSVWLTGAAAAHDIAYYMSQYPEKFTMEEADKALSDFDFCLRKYENLLDESHEKGFLVDEERLVLMMERASQLLTRLKAQQVYVRRSIRESEGVKKKNQITPDKQ